MKISDIDFAPIFAVLIPISTIIYAMVVVSFFQMGWVLGDYLLKFFGS